MERFEVVEVYLPFLVKLKDRAKEWRFLPVLRECNTRFRCDLKLWLV